MARAAWREKPARERSTAEQEEEATAMVAGMAGDGGSRRQVAAAARCEPCAGEMLHGRERVTTGERRRRRGGRRRPREAARWSIGDSREAGSSWQRSCAVERGRARGGEREARGGRKEKCQIRVLRDLLSSDLQSIMLRVQIRRDGDQIHSNSSNSLTRITI